ncbi:putative oxalate decarboxylase oxdC [Paramyrothecium foliicola]|nr:putative oxalate decarboxylase oxdC [Paramyrothecium foliicola]
MIKLLAVTTVVVFSLLGPAVAAPRMSNKSPEKRPSYSKPSTPGHDDRSSNIQPVATNEELDQQNPDNLYEQPTDNGRVPNLKWSLSDSLTYRFDGGWAREQVVQDLPLSQDIAGHILISVVDEHGVYQVRELGYGDLWYFPEGMAHTLQGLDDDNEYLVVLDGGDVNGDATIFHVDDWLAHIPKDVLAKNFGVPESTFDHIPSEHPYIMPGNVSKKNVTGAVTPIASGNSSFVYRTFEHPAQSIGGDGGTLYKIDSTNFPIAKTIAAVYVSLKPGAMRELHWHTNSVEWVYFHQGKARATAFIGNSKARTYDFRAGDAAVFPDNSGHYIENIGEEDLTWIEIFKADRVTHVSLTQWLALTPPDIVSQALHIPIEFVEQLKKEKQVFSPGREPEVKLMEQEKL